MHVAPELASQQSDVWVHLSPSIEHPEVIDRQTPPAPPSAPAEGEQKPPQQSVPVVHEAPSAPHGGSAQKPRIAMFISFCPVRWNAGWLGSTPGFGFWSMAATQSCLTSLHGLLAHGKG